MTLGFAERRRWWRRRVAQRGSATYGVIDNRSEILQHLRRALYVARAELGSKRSAEFGSVDHLGCPHARARIEVPISNEL